MTPSVLPPTPTVGPTPSLIPSETAVQNRLVAVCREARLLRRLRRLSREAAAINSEALPTTRATEGSDHVA
jgi:hypothetical protein